MVRVSLLSAAIAAATLAHAIPPPTSEIIPGRYIVEFEPSASPARNQFSVNTNTNTNGSDKDSAGGATLLGNLGIRAEIKHRYDATFSGMAVQLSNDSDVDRLRNAAGVKRVTPVYRHHIQMSSSKRSLSTAFAADGSASSSPSGPTPPGPEVAEPLRQVHNLTDLLAARSKYNLTGKGIKVGIVDSGIDYTHPDLGGCFGPGCRVAYGYDFVDKTDVKDCLGHGTLVAGIIGAARTSTVSSVAPDVTFGAYRIGSCEGEVDESNVVAAVDQAVKDGSDVINLSMGWYPRYPWDPLSTAVRNAAKKGVTVVTAGGNTGPRLYTVTTPAVVSETITVGAVDNLVQAAYGFNVSFAGASQQAMLPIDGFVGETGDKDLAAVGTRQLAVAMSGDRAANCTVSNQSDLAGKFVVWEQSDESCGARAFVSMLAVKPSAVIIPYLDGYQRPSYNASAAIQAGIPAFTVSKHTHVRLKDGLSKGPATVSGVIGMRTFDNPTAGELSIWSSRGPSAELLLKPQVLAPGGFIYSTAPASLGLGSYMVMYGTSFAAPYVTGLVALYLQQFGKQSPEKIQAAIMNSARTKIPREAGLFDGIDSPANIGSGVVNASAFLDPNTSLLTPSQVSLNDTARAGFFGTYVLPLTITNNAKTTTMYDLVHEPSVSVAPNWSNRFVPHLYAKRYADVAFLSSSSVIVPAGRSKEFWISITPPAGLDVKALYAYGGYVVAKPRDSSLPSVKSVYYGVKGDMSTADVVQDATFTLNPVDKLPDGTSVFDPYRDSKANALLKLRYASRRVEAFYESSDGRRAGGYLASLSNVGSDWVKTLIPLADYTCDAKALEQNGGICAAGGSANSTSAVKPGRYRVVIRAQRPFSVSPETNEMAWQRATSGWFYLNSTRPVNSQ